MGTAEAGAIIAGVQVQLCVRDLLQGMLGGGDMAAHLPRLGMHTEGGFQQMVHLFRHLHIQSGVGKSEENVSAGPPEGKLH